MREGGAPRRPFKRPVGDRDLGPGWRAPGRGRAAAARQAPAGPHVMAPGQEKA